MSNENKIIYQDNQIQIYRNIFGIFNGGPTETNSEVIWNAFCVLREQLNHSFNELHKEYYKTTNNPDNAIKNPLEIKLVRSNDFDNSNNDNPLLLIQRLDENNNYQLIDTINPISHMINNHCTLFTPHEITKMVAKKLIKVIHHDMKSGNEKEIHYDINNSVHNSTLHLLHDVDRTNLNYFDNENMVLQLDKAVKNSFAHLLIENTTIINNSFIRNFVNPLNSANGKELINMRKSINVKNINIFHTLDNPFNIQSSLEIEITPFEIDGNKFGTKSYYHIPYFDIHPELQENQLIFNPKSTITHSAIYQLCNNTLAKITNNEYQNIVQFKEKQFELNAIAALYQDNNFDLSNIKKSIEDFVNMNISIYSYIKNSII